MLQKLKQGKNATGREGGGSRLGLASFGKEESVIGAMVSYKKVCSWTQMCPRTRVAALGWEW